jgi:hypothetical protein
MAEGRSNQGIAEKLVITVRAVEKYVSSIFDKLGLPSSGSESRRVLAVLSSCAPDGRETPETRPTGKYPVFQSSVAPATLASSPTAEERLMKTRIIQGGPEPVDPEEDRPSDVPAADAARAADVGPTDDGGADDPTAHDPNSIGGTP